MYLSNNLISSFRLYNGNRTSNASITFPIDVSLNILEGNLLKKLKAKLLEHVKNHPRRWDGVQFVRIDNVDQTTERVTLMISVRHRNTWQDAPRIKKDKGNLIRALCSSMVQLDVAPIVPPNRAVLYHGGVLEEGANSPRRSTLLQPGNVIKGKSL